MCLYAAARLQPPDFEHAALLALVLPPSTGAFCARFGHREEKLSRIIPLCGLGRSASGRFQSIM